MNHPAQGDAAVLSCLEDAQRRGFLGPGPVDAHVAHAWPLVEVLPSSGLIVDLGSGGGVPALVLILALPDTTWALVESQRRRATFLGDAIGLLGVTDRVRVERQRAEDVGRGALRGGAVAVTARSFAPPAVTAECAAPLLQLGARAWVAEPPDAKAGRWPVEGLDLLGLVSDGDVRGWTALRCRRACPERYPRRVGIPEKRPLF